MVPAIGVSIYQKDSLMWVFFLSSSFRQDKYLHTNCLAALANMSAQFRSLHQYAAQRIIR